MAQQRHNGRFRATESPSREIGSEYFGELLSVPSETVNTPSSSGVIEALRIFVAERDWAQFHTPENLAKSISIESAELLECFQWSSEVNEGDVRAELADVLTYCLLLADKYGWDANQLVLNKLEESIAKYPADKARGRSTKYDRL